MSAPLRRGPDAPHHGAAAVGDIDALPAPLSLGVRMLRDWCDGPAGQERIWNAFASGLPMPAARAGMRRRSTPC